MEFEAIIPLFIAKAMPETQHGFDLCNTQFTPRTYVQSNSSQKLSQSKKSSRPGWVPALNSARVRLFLLRLQKPHAGHRFLIASVPPLLNGILCSICQSRASLRGFLLTVPVIHRRSDLS